MTKEEEYKIFLNHVVDLTQRRQTVTTTYLSVSAAIAAAIAFLFKDGQLEGWSEQLSALVLLISGVFASNLWRLLVGQYSKLIGWWYEQLRALEGGMSVCSELVIKEYDEWYSKKQGKKATLGLTGYEIGLTWIFMAIYTLFSLLILIVLIRGLV